MWNTTQHSKAKHSIQSNLTQDSHSYLVTASKKRGRNDISGKLRQTYVVNSEDENENVCQLSC